MIEEQKLSIGLIGGSGLYEILENPTLIEITTPFSDSPVIVQKEELEDRILFFIPRHGKKHQIPPHKINYKANVFAFHKLGCKYVISTNAVGSLRKDFVPGDYVIIDQFIDFFHTTRPTTFFDGDFEVTIEGNQRLAGVVHTDMTHPYCNKLRERLYEVVPDSLKEHCHFSGTYLTSQGPRFETPAEIRAMKVLGADVVGMTNSTEAILFKELHIHYATVAVVTNYGAGMQEKITHQEVIEIFNRKINELKMILRTAAEKITMTDQCDCF